MNGIELYNQMRSRSIPVADRVVLMTGDLMDPNTRAFLASTDVPHLEKPFTSGELEDALAKFFR